MCNRRDEEFQLGLRRGALTSVGGEYGVVCVCYNKGTMLKPIDLIHLLNLNHW